jgi:hypothetical protein
MKTGSVNQLSSQTAKSQSLLLVSLEKDFSFSQPQIIFASLIHALLLPWMNSLRRNVGLPRHPWLTRMIWLRSSTKHCPTIVIDPSVVRGLTMSIPHLSQRSPWSWLLFQLHRLLPQSRSLHPSKTTLQKHLLLTGRPTTGREVSTLRGMIMGSATVDDSPRALIRCWSTTRRLTLGSSGSIRASIRPRGCLRTGYRTNIPSPALEAVAFVRPSTTDRERARRSRPSIVWPTGGFNVRFYGVIRAAPCAAWPG